MDSLRSLLLSYIILIYISVSSQVHALCTEEDLRLTDITPNTTDYIEGRLQICLNDSWTGICYSFPNNFAQQNYSIVWNNNDARVACKQMGYLTTNSSSSYVTHTSTTLFNVFCFGYESKLVECNTQFRDSHEQCDYDAGVQCKRTAVSPSCTQGDIIRDNTNGILQYCDVGMWKRICADYWTNNNAAVACNQLGYSKQDADVTLVDPSLINSAYFPGHFYCSGREEMLNDCFKAAMPPFRYTCQSLPKLSCLPRTPEIFYTWPLNSTTIKVKWQLSYPTQDVPTRLNITCFNTNDIEDHIISTISDLIETTQEISIDGFTASTKYTCCISVTSEIGTSQDVCQNVTLFNNVEQVSCSEYLFVTQCEHLRSSTIYQNQVQATPSTIQEIIKETSDSSLILLRTTVQILLTTTVQIRETVTIMPNVKEMDCKVSSIIGGVIGWILGAVVVITICIIAVCVFFTLRRKKIKLHNYNNKGVASSNIIFGNPTYQDDVNEDAYACTLINELYGSTEQTGREEYPYATVDKKDENYISESENCYEMQDTSDHPKESKPIIEVDILPNDSTYNTLLRSASPTLPMSTNGQYSQIKAISQPDINQTSQQQDYREIYSTVDN